jgi:hypothetical protein
VNHEQIVATADKIRHSSAYAAGDPTTFKVRIVPGQVELPAPSDPVAYMADVQAKLKFSLPPGARICVVGAGYCGLAAHFLNEGAKQVIVVEPRFRFHAGLDMLVPLLDAIHAPENAETIKAFKAWPQQGHVESLGQFDLVICPEGFDECPEPVETLTALLKMVNDRGGLVMEVLTGESTQVPATKVNSWRPTAETFSTLLLKINQGTEFRDANSRAVNRRLFAVRPGRPEKPALKATTYSEPMPRPIQKAVPPAPPQAPKPSPKPSVVADNPAAKALADAVAKDEAAKRATEKHKPAEVHISPEVPAEEIEPVKTEVHVEKAKPKKRG